MTSQLRFRRFPAAVLAVAPLAAIAAATAALAAEGSGSTLNLLARSRPGPADAREIREEALSWDPKKTAIVVCDMWDRHWCNSATRRVGEMAPKMNRVIAGARAKGVFIIHAPSSCMEAYRDTPQRKLAQAAPDAKPPEGIEGWCRKLAGEPDLPIDDSDGGCDCEPQCKTYQAWSRQIGALEIAAGDAVSDSGREIWNLLAQRGIDGVLVMGVHTNMCVSGRPFGLRQMAKNGKKTLLVRDLTDTMYNPRKSPFVPHRRGTDLVIEHIEKHICPSVLADDLAGDPPAPRVVFIIGEDEYRTETTLPAFAARELEPRGVRSVFVKTSPESPNDFPGVEALREADLLILSVRRRTPRDGELAQIRAYLDDGRPLVGIRTASHSFDKDPPAGHARWATFDTEVLGCKYEGHYGTGPACRVQVIASKADHPVVRGLPKDAFAVGTTLYKLRSLAPSATALAVGRLESSEEEPVAVANVYRGGRIFYTSLGGPEDFEVPAFRRLLLNAVYWALERQPPAGASAGAGPGAGTR